MQVQRAARPASYAGDADRRTPSLGPGGGGGGARTHCYVNRVPDSREHSLQYASSGSEFIYLSFITPCLYTSEPSLNSVLDEMDCVSTGGASADALKTRSLPAFLRPKPRPLSTEDDLHQLYDKVTECACVYVCVCV